MPAIVKTSKKRAAAAHSSAPSHKKPHLGKSAAKAASKPRRSQRITVPAQPDNDESEDDEIEDGDEDEGNEDGAEWVDEDGSDHDDIAMDVDSQPAKDPNAIREARKAQKVVQDQRKAAKPHSDLLAEAKKLWSLARQRNTSPEERQKHVQSLMNLIRGKVKDIVFKHDASRIIQTIVRNGKQKERDEIAVELKGRYKDLAQNKYSKFLVSKLIRLCPTHRASILTEFQGHVIRLLLHREASSVLADAFELWANSYERTILVREFYGKEAALFATNNGGEADKAKAKDGLKGILDGSSAEQQKRILNATKDSLVTIFNNSDKGAVSHAIVHRALWEYISAVSELPDEAERERQRREMFECCQDVLAEMVHTKDGSRVVRGFLAYGTAKDRKLVLKALKPHIERVCLDEEAQFVLFTALDVIDDTKQVAKTLVSSITASAQKLYLTPQGRRSLLYLIVPRSRRHFTPAQIALLAETDEIRALTSKKEADVREAEIREAASESLISWVTTNAADIAREPGGSLVLAEIMLCAAGDKSAAIKSLLQAISTTYPSLDPSNPHLIDLPHGSRLYKNLLQGGHFNHTTKEVDRAVGWDAAEFAEKFVEIVGEDVSVAMCAQGEANGAFVIAELCDAIHREGKSATGQTVKDSPPLNVSLLVVHPPLSLTFQRPPKGTKKKAVPAPAPSSDGSATPHIPSLSEQLSYLHNPRPFKNPSYTKNSNRRTKNLKAVLGQEKERERAERERRRQQKLESMDVDEGVEHKDSTVEEEDLPTYSSIEAPPSFLPQKRYCDITGLEAPYTDPATGLRYHDKSVYELIKTLSTSSAKDYLSARGVNSIVK
ncbi:pumilio domain member 6 [Pleurotus pulmonarius]|nr:pumilio domain member 6 [Pleurotus pulmonarius]